MRAVHTYNTDERLVSERSGGSGRGLPLVVWSVVALLGLAGAVPVAAQSGGEDGIPYSAVFSETAQVGQNPLRGQLWSIDPYLKVGDADLRATRLSLNTTLNLPVKVGSAPRDAMFHLGPLYLNFPRSSLEFIASDNADREKDDRESGVIGMFSTDFNLLLQLTDSLQIRTRGRFIYLPFEGKAGFVGNDDFRGWAGVDVANSLFMEAQYDTTIGEWDLFASERIGLEYAESGGLYSRRYADARLYYLGNNDFDEADTLGRYHLGSNGGSGDSSNDQRRKDRWEFESDGYFNRVAVGVSRMVPTDTLVALTAFRYDRWGMDREDHSSRWREGINLSLINQHYNTRFKPYFTYTASRGSYEDYWDHVARLGVVGPLSDYTEFNGNVGYRWRTKTSSADSGDDNGGILWYVSLHNELNELTTQRLTYARSVRPDSSETNTTLSYSLRRILGPHLSSSLFFDWTERREDDDADGAKGDQTRYEAGTRLAWDASSRLTLTLIGRLSAVQEEDSDNDYEEYSVQLASEYDITDTLSLWLSYEYTIRDDETPGDSYYENLVRMRLTKRW